MCFTLVVTTTNDIILQYDKQKICHYYAKALLGFTQEGFVLNFMFVQCPTHFFFSTQFHIIKGKLHLEQFDSKTVFLLNIFSIHYGSCDMILWKSHFIRYLLACKHFYLNCVYIACSHFCQDILLLPEIRSLAFHIL